MDVCFLDRPPKIVWKCKKSYDIAHDCKKCSGSKIFASPTVDIVQNRKNSDIIPHDFEEKCPDIQVFAFSTIV